MNDEIGHISVFIDQGLQFDREHVRLLSLFIEFCIRVLDISGSYECHLVESREAHGIKTTAVCLYGENVVKVYCKGRLFSDILRSIGHEFFHIKQHENGLEIPVDYLHFSSKIEDDANKVAGKLLNAFSGVLGYESIYSKGI